jgi:hypothetical protein
MSPLEIIFSTLSVPERRVPQRVHSASYSVVRPDVNDLHRQLVAFWAREWQVQHFGSRGELFYCRTKAMIVGE